MEIDVQGGVAIALLVVVLGWMLRRFMASRRRSKEISEAAKARNSRNESTSGK